MRSVLCMFKLSVLLFANIRRSYSVGVRDKWPNFKCKIFKSTQWFSYKIWTKNSEEPIVYLHNWPLPETHHFFENTIGNPFFDNFKYWPKRSKKNFKNRNMDILISNLLSKSIFDFRKWSNQKYTNTRITYFQFDHLPKSKIDSESRYEMRISILLF